MYSRGSAGKKEGYSMQWECMTVRGRSTSKSKESSSGRGFLGAVVFSLGLVGKVY